MDSPRGSEKSQTRFSTPVSDLDDHRHQSPIPPAYTAGSSHRGTITRRPTVGSTDGRRPDLLQVDESLREAGSITRDFEQAIIDDDKSNIEETAEGDHGNLSGIPKRGLSRRIHNTLEHMGRTRDRSPSLRSISPPNSVDAFASHRRERAPTFGSKAASDVDLTLKRTVSAETHRRRPTFSGGSVRQPEPVGDSDRPEEDVCFPEPEATTEFAIDFEELEEFAADMKSGRVVSSTGSRQRHSFSSQGTNSKIYGGRSPAQPPIPQIVKQLASPMGHDFDSGGIVDLDSVCNEKVGTDFDGQPPFARRPSMAEPNRYSFFSSEIEHTIHAPELGDLVMHDESFRELFHLPQEGGAWWLDVMNPSEAELEMFQKAFGIHRLTAEDIERQEIREKVELFKQYYFVCFRSFYQMDKTSEDYLEPVNVYMVVFREGIITFRYAPSPHASDVRKRIGKLRNYINLTADWICYALIDNIVDSFGPVIRSIELETDQIEDQVFVAREDDLSPLLRHIGECRKKVMQLMRLLGGKADVIKGFAKRCNEEHSVAPRSEIGLYLGDVQDHVVTMMSNLGHFEKMLSRSHSNYLAQLSVDHMAQGNRANKVLSKITLVATVLVPLNMISGLFGMNVPVPGRETTSLSWFFGILGVIVAIAITSMAVARRYRVI
ncbi:magnesium and cobalt transport protein CorA [Ptychographa xylographoides]|nr:magnesium and cobalt transport protein CorA [Ptychographa xylographoides]